MPPLQASVHVRPLELYPNPLPQKLAIDRKDVSRYDMNQ